MKHALLPALLLLPAPLVLAACGNDPPDAYGNFEATEVAVSAEFPAVLAEFALEEGQAVTAGEGVGRLDTVPLALQRRELEAQAEAARLRADEARAQVAVYRSQLKTAREELDRVERLYAATAATAQQRTQAQGAVETLEEQIEAGLARVRSARQEEVAVETRRAQLEDRFRRSRIESPLNGTVLATFAEAGEYVQPGRPLFTVAALDTLVLRAWLSGNQLPRVRLGQEVRVQVDDGAGGLRVLPGRISWIASRAEFTPTPIQTREERVDQVYGVKVRVANRDGLLKIGMPGELLLPDASGEPGSGG